MQTKANTSFITQSEIKRTHKPPKIAAEKNYFSKVFAIDTVCFDECFLFHVMTRNHCCLQNFIVTLRYSQPQCCCFPSNKLFERIEYITLSPQ